MMFGEHDRQIISIEREKFREIKKGDIFFMGQDKVRVLAKVNKVSWRYENGREFYWFSMKYIARKDLETGEVKRWNEEESLRKNGKERKNIDNTKYGFLLSYSCNQDEGTQRHLPHGSWGFSISPENFEHHSIFMESPDTDFNLDFYYACVAE